MTEDRVHPCWALCWEVGDTLCVWWWGGRGGPVGMAFPDLLCTESPRALVKWLWSRVDPKMTHFWQALQRGRSSVPSRLWGSGFSHQLSQRKDPESLTSKLLYPIRWNQSLQEASQGPGKFLNSKGESNTWLKPRISPKESGAPSMLRRHFFSYTPYVYFSLHIFLYQNSIPFFFIVIACMYEYKHIPCV